MRFIACLFASLLFVCSILGCGDEDSPASPSNENNNNNNTSDSFSLPLHGTFDDSESEIRTHWWWGTNGALGTLMWELDDADKAGGSKSIRTPQITYGWMCAQSNQVCWNGGFLRTAKPIDLTDKTSAQLTFMNKRTTTPLSSAPGCWSDIVSENEIAFCVYWGLTTSVRDWTVLQTFRGGVSQWHLETVPLNSLAGRKVYIGFAQKGHCTEKGNTSASWQVDEVVITGN